jgi:hypothetical protein
MLFARALPEIKGVPPVMVLWKIDPTGEEQRRKEAPPFENRKG